MGLDMYAYSVPAEAVGDQQVDIKFTDKQRDDPEFWFDFAYFRKFHQLHGWMQRLYIEKGGSDGEVFNCDTVRLMPEDIDRLERDASVGLPDKEGFFFGNYPENSFDEERRQELAEFIAKCREEFDCADKRAIVYDSWW